MDGEDEVELKCEPVQPVKRTMILRRSTVVQKNLEPLWEKQKKKKLAQGHFYEATENVSPMLRVEEEKAPVHERLGVSEPQPVKKRLTLRRNFVQQGRMQQGRMQQRMRNQQGQRNEFRNNNNNNRRNNMRRRRFIPPNGIITKKYRYNAQQRLNMIRSSFDNCNNLMTGNKKILRRTRPMNYQIVVPNHGPIRHSVKASLTPCIQEQLMLFREESTSRPQDPIPNVALPIANSTRVTMHERFSSYP